MRVAVHHREGTYSARWLARLADLGISYDVVDGFADDLLPRLEGVDLFLWHWSLGDPRELAHARDILTGIEHSGCAVFPDSGTCSHYDNKIAQKYLLEAAGAPFVPTHVFYCARSAMDWLESAQLPVVFKLARGAGSSNVQLVDSKTAGKRLIEIMFGPGMRPVPNAFYDLRRKVTQTSAGGLWTKVRRAPATLRAIRRRSAEQPLERGYAYFQEFLPGNAHDTRIYVIGNRAIGLQRRNRPGDFRASGSGDLLFDHRAIPTKFVDLALRLSSQLGFQAMAYDFLQDTHGNPVICEISYCVSPAAYLRCEGYWDVDLSFHSGRHYIEDFILDDLIAQHSRREGTQDISS